MASSLSQAPSSKMPAADLESFPLFMRNLPEGDSENVALEAIRSLVYEGTPEGERVLRLALDPYFQDIATACLIGVVVA